ncbi:MAG: PAS domain S-box protein [Nevskiales bacterium]|nr:PAS domain S-box protein [Nevskiales bacterium]
MDRVVQAGSESPFRAVLLLCDDAAVSGRVRAELDRLGVAISVHALTRRSDLERDLVASAPALVLLDPGMPGLNARDVLLELRSQHPDAPVLVLASGPPDETVLDLLAAGAADCILLPDMKRLGPALQRLSQKAAASTDRLFRQLVETASDVLMLTALDGTVRYISPAVKTLTGYTPEEVIGRRYLEFIAPEDAERARHYLAELVSSPGRTFRQELRIRCRDGSTLDVESAVSNQSDVPGIGGIVADVRDISRSKASEARLREANTLIEQSPTVLFRWRARPGWPIVHVSQNVRQWGYDADTLITAAQHFADLMHPDDVASVERQVDAALAAGDDRLNLEYRVKTADGTLRWVNEHTVIERDASGAPLYYQGVVADITERKAVEQREQAELARTQAQLEVIGVVGASEALLRGDVPGLARQAAELGAFALGVERANVWLFNADATELQCVDLFEATPARHSSGMVLTEAEYGNEFRALKAAGFVAADDAQTDPRTIGYLDGYLRPNRITSMLDAVIRIGDMHVGLLCFEHVDQPHRWEADEIRFAQQLADKLGLCVESGRRLKADAERAEAQRVAHLGNWWLVPETGEVRWSEEVYRIFGLDPARPAPDLGHHPELLTADSMTRLNAAIDASVAAVQGFVLELELARPSGEHRWIEARGEPVCNADGAVVAMRGTAQDITERKQAETELRLFRALVDRTSDAIEVLDPVTFQFLDCNEEAFRALGYSREELLGFTVFDIDPRARAMDLKAISERLCNDEVVVFDTIHRRKDATEFPVEVSLRYVRQDRLYLVSVVRDITERKRVEEDLRASKEVIEGILDAIPVRVFWKDANLRYLGCNAAFARDAGYAEPRQLIGKDDSEMGWRDQAELYRADDRAVIESGQAKLLIEEPQTTPDGRTIVLLTSKLPLRDARGEISGVLGTYMDVTEHKERERALARKTRALTALSSGNSVLVHARTEAELYQDMVNAIVEAGGYKMAWVGLAEHGEGLPVRPVGKAGDDTGYVDAAKLTWSDQTERGRGPSGLCIRTGQSVISRNIETDPVMAPWRDAARAAGFAASAAIPLKNGADTFGELCIYSADPAAFDEDEIALLEEMAGDLAFGVIALRTRDANLNNLERLERSMEGTVRVLAGTVELRDPYTAGHQQRVATIADAIAGVMDLSEDRRQGLRLAAMVHDIGKLSVPSEILAKPGRLTNLEYQLVMAHAESGYEILKDVEFPWPVAEIVRQHHERVDGSGYPRGLSGEQILLEARILAVADTLEAMSTHRPYRPARGVDAALDVIADGRGALFDPAVVDACLELIRKRHFVLPD